MYGRKPDLYQREYGAHFVVVKSRICTALKQFNLTRKKKERCYLERNLVERAIFIYLLRFVPLSQLVFIDECGLGKQDGYAYGYAPRGKKNTRLLPWS
jgi:hypothetical protein